MRLKEHLVGAVGPVLRYQALCKKCKAANTKNSSLHVTRDANQLWRTKVQPGSFAGKKSGRFLTSFQTLEISLCISSQLAIYLHNTYDILP
jgi:hypothetical protein